MANPEHVDILKQGADIWNQWRKDNPDTKPDLDQANLIFLNLSYSNLSYANFNSANLAGSDLSGANLIRASFVDANLKDVNFNIANITGTDFSVSTLIGANFSDAVLSETDFSHADLSRALLSGIDLTNVDFSYATLQYADLRNADLSEASLEEADLNGANLSGAILRETNLTKANLSRANLSGVNLSTTKLWHTILSEALLHQANLSNTNLFHTQFSDADLSNANLTASVLRRADLRGANLSRATLDNTSFQRTTCGFTIFGDVDLSTAIELDSIYHNYPSIVGVDTIFRSKGKIPEVFLRGCGVPETLITFLPSMLEEAIQFYSCFISYSHADKEFAKRLHDRLQGIGIRCWLDEHQFKPGDELHKTIYEGIRVYDKVILCCSESSLKSWWVEKEFKNAISKEEDYTETILIPLSVDGYIYKQSADNWTVGEIKRRFVQDFSNWKDHDAFESAFKKVVAALRTDGGKPPPPTSKLTRRR